MNEWESLAEHQYGIVTRDQLRGDGQTDRQIERLLRDRLERVHRGVFRVRGSYPSTRQRAMAAMLWCGENSVLSYSSAGMLLRLPIADDGFLHISVANAAQRRHEAVRVHRTVLKSVDQFRVDGLPCTNAARTIIDLAALLDAEALEHAFDHARRHGLLTVNVFARRVEQLAIRGRAGSRALRSLLANADARPKESRLELRVARLLRKVCVTPPRPQFRVPPYRLDFAWPTRCVAVECDGFEFHGRRLAWKRDRRRVAHLEHAGWRLVHLTWDDLARPREVVERLRNAGLEIRPPRSGILVA